MFDLRITVLNFRAIYSAIYEFSHGENGPATYSLAQAGNTKYEEFIDRISASLNSQWARNISPEDVSKDDRHVLRLAAVMHVFYDYCRRLSGLSEIFWNLSIVSVTDRFK